jgi:intein/homing endonuclease
MNIQEIKEELSYCYPNNLNDFLGDHINNLSDQDIKNKFKEHVRSNSKKVKIKDIIENYRDSTFLINTPDGFQEVGDFYIKGPKPLYDIETVDNYKTISSGDHKFESNQGWKFAKDLNVDDYLLTKEGFRKILNINKLDDELVYDFEVLHDNHRYWSGNGLSSHNTGKTYIALSICRNAQKMGYTPIYFDSEGSIDADFVAKLGVDISNIRLQPVNTVEEFSHIAAQIVKQFEEAKAKGETPPKIMIVLDSLGNLTSIKEKADTVSGDNKRDMTKQQAIRRLFRVNGLQFAMHGIPFIVNNHVYDCIFGDAKVKMENDEFRNINKINKGEKVWTLAGPREVLDTFEYDVSNYIELEFEDGYIIKCTDKHKFGVESKSKEIIWKTADEIEEGEQIIHIW